MKERVGGQNHQRTQAHKVEKGNIGRTGGGAVFASPTRLGLIPWEDGSARQPGRPFPDQAEGACHRAAGQGGGAGADGGGPARGDRAAQRAEGSASAQTKWDGEGQRAEGSASAQTKWDGEGQRAEAAQFSQGPPRFSEAARSRRRPGH